MDGNDQLRWVFIGVLALGLFGFRRHWKVGLAVVVVALLGYQMLNEYLFG